MKQFAVLGDNVIKSGSPLLYRLISKGLGLKEEFNYTSINISSDDLSKYLIKLHNKEYVGYNVTSPYKQLFFDLIEDKDKVSKEVGNVNTIVYKKSKIKGYNTDYPGIQLFFKHFKLNINNSKVIILGTGSIANTLAVLLRKQNNEVFFVSRNPSNKVNCYSYSNINEIKDATWIFNCASTSDLDVNYSTPFSFVDLNYNKGKVRFSNKPVYEITGEFILIAQALYSYKIFFDSEFDELELYPKIIDAYLKEKRK